MHKNTAFVLLHGWGMSNTIWHDFAELLGRNSKISTPCLYEAAINARDYKFESIAKVLNGEIKPDVIVVAWSIGGLVAIPLAKLTNNVKAIIFVASTPCFVIKKDWSNVIERKGIENLQMKLSKSTTSTLEYFADLITHGDVSTKESNEMIRNNLADEKHGEILSSWLTQMQETDQRKELAELNLPVQFIFGENDSLIDSKIENQTKQLNSNIQSVIINNCGHAPFISKQDQTSMTINKFINATLN